MYVIQTSSCVGDQYLNVRSICFFTCVLVVSSKCIQNGSLDLTKSLTISCVKYFDMPSAIMYDALVRLSLKFAAILLSGNIALNKSPMLSTDRRLKLLTDTFTSQKISAFMLSLGVINPRDCDEQAELSPDCFEKATSFFCFLSTLCLIASMRFFCLLCCNN